MTFAYRPPASSIQAVIGLLGMTLLFAADARAQSTAAVPTPEAFFGFRVGADKKLVRYDRIVEYLQTVAGASDRVRYRKLGDSTLGNPFAVVEISAPETLRNLDHFKQLERRLYFHPSAPTVAERDEIFEQGKAVVLVTASIHGTEIGASQMVLELVHRLATDDSPKIRKILDNVIFLLIPTLNPDGQIIVTDWYNKNLGTPYEASPLPWLYHHYIGHDNNRDLLTYSQKESQLTAELLWHDWFPAVWLDEHQMGSNGARIFTMPAKDPISPNVDPVIYRLETIFGQIQASALESEGKTGIIRNSMYTSFWPGAMAWTGWWHNQVGMLTEVASARIASPIEQRKADPNAPSQPESADRRQSESENRRQLEHPDEPLPAPRDTTSRADYPRPWLGGTWHLRDIVDYELTATIALLEAAADNRSLLLHDIYEANRNTIELGARGDIGGNGKAYAAIIPASKAGQHDPNEVGELLRTFLISAIDVYRATKEIEVDGKRYPAGTYVIPFNQVFGRLAKDVLEKQKYPEVRPAPGAPPEAPYDAAGWSIGLQFGVKSAIASQPLPADLPLEKVATAPLPHVDLERSASGVAFEYRGASSAVLLNRLLKQNAKVRFANSDRTASVWVEASGIKPADLARLTQGFEVAEKPAGANKLSASGPALHAPRIGLYQPWTGNMDEGWTRWSLEHYEFAYKTLHNADVRAGHLRSSFDVIVFPDQRAKDIVTGLDYRTIREEYRGGIGEDGVTALREFLDGGGTLVALGESAGLFIDRLPIPVKDLKRGLTREQHYGPGTVVGLEVDTRHPLGRGVAPQTWGFYNELPFYQLVEGFASQKAGVVARYPNANVNASGWLRGEELMAGHAAVVAIENNPGKIVLFGIRPQNRAQTHATLPLLFNALYWSAEGDLTQ
jgi:hypothetical protein